MSSSTPPSRPRWIAGANESTWHTPVAIGAYPQTACGRQLSTPVHGSRGDLPAEPPRAAHDPGAGGLTGRTICPVCARKLAVDPSGERRTLRDARLQRALHQAEYRPYGRGAAH